MQETKTGNEYREPRLKTKTKNRVQRIRKEKDGEKEREKIEHVMETVSPLKNTKKWLRHFLIRSNGRFKRGFNGAR